MPSLEAILQDRQFVHLSTSQNLFGGRHALPVLVVNAPFCKATVALQGAQLLTFQPRGNDPWLWLSPSARFEQGKSIRGGIPVCLPWFGAHRQDPGKPKHGFVRNREWLLATVAETVDMVKLQFRLDYAADTPELFATPFSALLTMELSTTLHITLELHNSGTETAEFSWALHTYFAVANCKTTHVAGLENAIYLDNTQGLQAMEQQGRVAFTQEVDRVYAGTQKPQTIISTGIDKRNGYGGEYVDDEYGDEYGHPSPSLSQPLSEHRLLVSGDNCPTCIVWNAGEAVAATLDDIGEYYTQYICVERGCAFADTLQLAAGQIFHSTLRIVRA